MFTFPTEGVIILFYFSSFATKRVSVVSGPFVLLQARAQFAIYD